MRRLPRKPDFVMAIMNILGRVMPTRARQLGHVLFLSMVYGGVVAPPVAWSQEPRMVLAGHGQRIDALAFSPNGSTLASGGPDRLVRLWDVSEGRLRDFQTPDGPVPATFLVATDVDKLVFAPATPTDPLHLGARRLPEHLRLVVVGADRSLTLWDAEDGRITAALPPLARPIVGIGFDAQGKMLATAAWDHQVGARMWEVASGIDRAVSYEFVPLPRSIAFSPDGRTMASGDFSGLITVRDLPGGAIRHAIKGHDDTVWCSLFAPDGKILVTGGGRGRVRLWDPANGRALALLEAHPGGVRALTFSPDGKTLATAGVDRLVRVWDVAEVLATGVTPPSADLPGEEP